MGMGTMNRDDFLAECLARPLDMAARHAFADWLEECGESYDARLWRRSAKWIMTYGRSRIIKVASRGGMTRYDLIFHTPPTRKGDVVATRRLITSLSEQHGIFVLCATKGDGPVTYQLTDLGHVVLAAWELSRGAAEIAAQPL